MLSSYTLIVGRSEVGSLCYKQCLKGRLRKDEDEDVGEEEEEGALAIQNSCRLNSFPDRINKADATLLQNQKQFN